ncbi:MAG: bifunctional glutamate N-acetyltransferase/amino-acid acetyltransferase ArgJ [Acidimicrobiia bacterium]
MSVTAASGFVAAAGTAGIKSSGDPDLAVVIAEDGPVPAAGVFTRNSAAAAPVTLSRRRLGGGRARAVLVNSGSANAGTGRDGVVDAEKVTKRLADLLTSEPELVLMCSTGPIGVRLPVDRIVSSLPGLVASADRDGGSAAAAAIITTDSQPKTAIHHGNGFTVGGMAKGAGMLRPDMATMLCVLTTDAEVNSDMLRYALEDAVPVTFNSLNIDGCESTNDSVILMASGRGMRVRADEFGEAVEAVCRRLALEMAADAEGSTRVVTLRIAGAADDQTARRYGKTIADSVLVRASFYGGDPNWGRILAALGTCQVDPTKVHIAYEGFTVAEQGTGVPFDDQKLAKVLTGDFVIDVIVGEGRGAAQVVTTDLTPDYVRFNGERS